jgi:rhamnosyl/mannosyltransferase
MRVLHFYKTSLPETMGGVEQVIHHLAKETQKFGIQSDVLTLTKNKSCTIRYANYRVFQVRRDFEIASTGFSWQVLFKFKQLLQSYDVIHYHYPWPFMDMVHFLLRIKKPSIVTYHSDIVKQQGLLKIYQPLQRWFLNQVNIIVATSPAYFNSSTTLQTYREKVRMVTYGLDPQSLKKPTQKLLEAWTKKIQSPFFLFVGVLRYYKGLKYLIEAAKTTEALIVIAGDGPLLEELQLQVKREQLKNVIFVGAVSDEDKSALLQLCVGFVFPSHIRSEAFGIALLEAAMLGKPMISCEIGTGTSFINQDKVTGFSVSPEDPKALSDAMNKLFQNPDLRQKMGKKAKERYQSIFTADRMVKSYVKLYQSLVKAPL